MKYLLTGGAGFIGSHLAEQLINNEHTVICVDDLSSGYIKNLPKNENLTFIEDSIQNLEVKKFSSLDGIFHLAAQASVPKSIDDFYESSSNNLLGTLKVWELSRNFNAPVVYASSSAIYGNLPEGDDTREKYDILSPYAQDKLTMEHYARMAYNVYKTISIGLRFFNVYGPRQDPTNPYSGVISIFTERLLKNAPVTVNGGYQTRDFIYVTDVVNTIIKSMQLLHSSNICEAFNVGTGVSVTIDYLLDCLKKILKLNPEIIRVQLPDGDPEISSGTYSKIKDTLNVNICNFISLNEGLIKTLNYYLSDSEQANISN